MFFDNYCLLCSNVGKSPTSVVVELGLAKSNVSNWKNGRLPKADVLQKVADYFGVTTDYLLNGDKEKATEPLPDDLASQRVAFFGDPGQAIDKDELAQLVLLKERMKAIKKIDSILEGLTDEQVIHFAQKLEELHSQK